MRQATTDGRIDVSEDITARCLHVYNDLAWHEGDSGSWGDQSLEEFYIVPAHHSVHLKRPDDPDAPWRLEQIERGQLRAPVGIVLHDRRRAPTPYRLDTMLRAALMAAIGMEGLDLNERSMEALARAAIVDMERPNLHCTTLDALLAGRVDAPFGTSAATAECRSLWPTDANAHRFAQQAATQQDFAFAAAHALLRNALSHNLIITDDVAMRFEKRLEALGVHTDTASPSL